MSARAADLMSISFLQVGEAVVRPHDEAAEIETALDELIQVHVQLIVRLKEEQHAMTDRL